MRNQKADQRYEQFRKQLQEEEGTARLHRWAAWRDRWLDPDFNVFDVISMLWLAVGWVFPPVFAIGMGLFGLIVGGHDRIWYAIVFTGIGFLLGMGLWRGLGR